MKSYKHNIMANTQSYNQE